MSGPDDERFRVRPGPPKNRQQKFVSQVIKAVGKAGGKASRSVKTRPGPRLGRGHVAARFAGQALASDTRRVTIKTRLVNLRQAGARSTLTHLRYIEREGVGRDQDSGKAYGPTTDSIDLAAFEERGRADRHQFRLIVSPEDAEQLDDLRAYTRQLMNRMEADLGTRLEWVAVNHWNTDNPHTHLVVRGKDDTGQDLIIARDYIAQGMRQRASELATEWLGPRTEIEVRHSLQREVEQERWTRLDATLLREAQGGAIKLDANPRPLHQRQLLIGRLQHLKRMELAHEDSPGIWSLRADAQTVLRAMGERGDILRTLQRAMGNCARTLAVFEPGEQSRPVIGRVAAKGLVDESFERGYLIIDGVDGKAHYVALPDKTDLEQYPLGAVVEARGHAEARPVDRTIAAHTVDGLYRTDHHLTAARGQQQGVDPHALTEAPVRRLEALRRAGIVERLTDGVWRVPADLTERGRQYDARRQDGVRVELHCHLPIERQIRVIGATWLDRQLLEGATGIGDQGFGGAVRQALRQRSDILIEQGLASRSGARTLLARNLLATLRNREVAAAAKAIEAETGLIHRPAVDGQRVSGVYRRSLLLASGRFALLDDGLGFSLVPWRPVIEPRLGQPLSAIARGQGVSWDLARQRGPTMGR